MKRDFRRLVALGSLLVGLVIAGCKHEPAAPTRIGCDCGLEKMESQSITGYQSELISLRRPMAKWQTVNGVKVYTFYYTATNKHLSPVGTHPVGWMETYQGNYPFEWTEQGWLGPDGEVYPEH